MPSAMVTARARCAASCWAVLEVVIRLTIPSTPIASTTKVTSASIIVKPASRGSACRRRSGLAADIVALQVIHDVVFRLVFIFSSACIAWVTQDQRRGAGGTARITEGESATGIEAVAARAETRTTN